MDIKLKNGKKFKIKNVTLDEKDTLLDSLKYEYNQDGTVKGVNMMFSTMTKWFRTCISDCTDELIESLSIDEKSEIFTKLQSIFFEGEGKASK